MRKINEEFGVPSWTMTRNLSLVLKTLGVRNMQECQKYLNKNILTQSKVNNAINGVRMKKNRCPTKLNTSEKAPIIVTAEINAAHTL